jgi:hypothetical protein
MWLFQVYHCKCPCSDDRESNNNNNSVMCTINRKGRMAVTLYTPDTVCFKHVSVDTLHKGDNRVILIIRMIGTMFSVFFATFSSYNLIRIRIVIWDLSISRSYA